MKPAKLKVREAMECDGRQQFTQLVMDQLIEQTINFNFKDELSGCVATGPDVLTDVSALKHFPCKKKKEDL